MARNEKAKATIYLDGKQAEAALDSIKNKAKEVRREMKAAQEAGDTIKYNKLKKELKSLDSATRSLRKETFDYQRVLNDLNGSSMSDLKKALRTVEVQLFKMKKTDPGYALKAAQAKKLRAEITRVNVELRGQNRWLNKVSLAFNKYMGVATVVIATLTGMAFSVKEFIRGLVGLDDALADVMKTTGMTRREVREMYTDFKYLNTRTPRRELLLLAEEAGRLGKKSKKDIEDFVEVANQIKVALGDDLGGEASVAIREVGKLTDIYRVGEQYGTGFKDSMTKVGSAINEVSANSNTQAPYLIDYLKRMGGIAGQMDVNAAKVIGYASALDQLGQSQEMAATAQGKVMVDMFKDQAKYAEIANMSTADFAKLLETDANEAFLRLLEGLNGNNEGFSVMAKKLDGLGINGARAVQVLSVLSANTKMVREQQDLANKAMEEGTSLTNEYNLKNNNLAGSMAKIGQALRSKFINSGFLGWMEKVVAKTARWAEVSVVKKLQDERNELNQLVMKITSLNEGEQKRLELINELIQKYPEYYGEIDAATVKNNELLTSLQGVNKQMVRQIYIAGRKEELAKLQENAAEKLAIEMKYQEDLNALKTSYFKKMAPEQQEIFTADFDFMMHQYEKITSLYSSSTQKAMAVTEWLQNNKLSKQFKGGLDYGDMTALSISYNEWREAYKRKYKAESEARAEASKIDAYVQQWGLGAGSSGSRSGIDALVNAPSGQQRDAFRMVFRSNPKLGNGILSAADKASARQMSEEEEKSDPALDYAVQKYKETLDFKLALNEAMYENGLIGEQQYQDQLTELTRQAEAERFAIKQENIERARSIAGMATNAVMALMDLELEKAGDNEEQKKKVKKKYADMNFAVTAAQIVADTAGAIMEGYRQLGPIGGAVASVLLGATGLLQLGIANKQRNNVKAMYIGGFAGYTGDGEKYEKKQLVQLHGSEYVIPKEGTENPSLKPFINMIEIARKGGSLRQLNIGPAVISTRREFSSGGSTSDDINPTQPYTDFAAMIAEMKEHNERTVEEIRKIKIYTSIEDVNDGQKRYIEIQETRGIS